MTRLKPFVAVVDEDTSVNRAIRRLLRSIGVAADRFATGDELLETMQSIPSYHPACVILDIQMPGATGLEVQQKLAASGVPVIFTTAHEGVAERDKALAAGAIAYIRRPFDDELLIKAVRAALESATRQ
jgi:FixJ family two-component response regulator